MPTFRCNVCEAFTAVAARAAEARCAACESRLDLRGTPQEVDDAALARAIALSPVPLLVDFRSPWCTPCVLSAPIIDGVGARMAGDIVALTVDVARDEAAGERHAIYAIPTIALFQDGEEVARRMGLLPGAEIERWIRRLAGPARAEAHA